MGMRELWEIVRRDELNSGETYIELGSKIFCRVDSADDPRVLRRALESASGQVIDLFRAMTEKRCPLPTDSVEHYAESCIDKARRELESEGQDGEKGA